MSDELVGDRTVGATELPTIAAAHGLRLQTSRRTTDECCGPVLYWLFDVDSGALVSPADGCSAAGIADRLGAVRAPAPARRSASGSIPRQPTYL